MNKSLTDMTLEELWELFPISLESPNPDWQNWAADEIKELDIILGSFHPVITHIGSTSIPHIKAKPIIDILVEVSSDVEWEDICMVMDAYEYICMSRSNDRISFNKGYTPERYADKVFHIHFHRIGDNNEIRFRDYLISHPDRAKEYEALKLSLLPEFKNNRDGYTEAKFPFIRRILELAGDKEES